MMELNGYIKEEQDLKKSNQDENTVCYKEECMDNDKDTDLYNCHHHGNQKENVDYDENLYQCVDHNMYHRYNKEKINICVNF